MNDFGYEAIEGIPYGLIACRIDGRHRCISGISPRCIQLRAPEAIPAGTAELFFYRPDAGGYVSHTLKNLKTGDVQRKNGAVLTRFFFDDAACAAAIRKTMNAYARYVQIRSEYSASAYGQEITGYPLEQDEIFCANIEEQRRAWFSRLVPLHIPASAQLAAELNTAALCRLYLDTPAVDFEAAYSAHLGLPGSFLSGCRISRLYVGNAYCRHLVPKIPMLEAIAEKAKREELDITLVTAELRAGDEARADALIAFARKHRCELAVNDWGMLYRASHSGDIDILLGTQLNRRRKDPRMAYKVGIAGNEHLLARNALNDSGWLAYLKFLGICRYEFESCGLPTDLPDGNSSLHLPFYQTNTSLWCPLHALCTSGSRGMQRPVSQCPKPCENNYLLYPRHLNMFGRWNSLLAFNPAWDSPELQQYDRIVLNF